MEEWKQIPKYIQYEISTLGRIRHKKHLKIRKCRIDPSGYYSINLNNPVTKRQETIRVHRLMGITFLAVNSSNHVVDHIDRNRLNNSLINLRLTTQVQNLANKSISKQTIERIMRMHEKGCSLNDICDAVCY